MDNICELLINVVNDNKPKTLTGLNQKVRGMDKALRFRFTQSLIPPANRQILSHLVKSMEHGKPDCLQIFGNRLAREGYRQAGMGCWKKRTPFCNGTDRGSKFALTRKRADFRLVLNHEKGKERLNWKDTVRQWRD